MTKKDYYINQDYPEMKEFRHHIKLVLHGISGSSTTRNLVIQELHDMNDDGLRYLGEMVHAEHERRWEKFPE